MWVGLWDLLDVHVLPSLFNVCKHEPTTGCAFVKLGLVAIGAVGLYLTRSLYGDEESPWCSSNGYDFDSMIASRPEVRRAGGDCEKIGLHVMYPAPWAQPTRGILRRQSYFFCPHTRGWSGVCVTRESSTRSPSGQTTVSTAMPSAGAVSGYAALPARIGSRSFYAMLFARAHVSRDDDTALPAGRTLFVLNVPHNVSDDGLEEAFSHARAGKVVAVRRIAGSSAAHVIFEQHGSLKKAPSGGKPLHIPVSESYPEITLQTRALAMRAHRR